MLGLKATTPDGKTFSFPLVKRITSVGRSKDNDISLADPAVAESALHIEFDGECHRVTSHEEPFRINGAPKDRHELALGEVIELGQSTLTFCSLSSEARAPVSADSKTDLAILRRLTAFSESLLKNRDPLRLLESLMDEAIDLTQADKGFLVLFENGELDIKVARNLSKENLERSVKHLSDSVISKVLKTRSPLVLDDALSNPEFKASQSVVNLKLSSVMCVPLMQRGELFGVLYLGNDRLTHRFEPKALDLLTIFASQASLLLQNALLLSELTLDNTELRRRLEDNRYGAIVGASSSMKEIYRKVDKIASTDISVLISGETGTGKEMIANEIHRRSPRKAGPFVSINCGAIPENLLESELFGHVKGAFTGAIATRNGRFQAAVGGTLFLDEIGDMPLALQVKLLRALQEKVVYKVGDLRGEPVDIRVLAASHKVLEDEMKQGRFREDLYYRLNVVTLRLPPLRERRDDVLVLGKYFLQKYAQEFGSKAKGFSPTACVAMLKYPWPGNIRELENRIKRAAVLSERALISAQDLELRPEDLEPVVPLAQAKEEFQKRYINEVLERNQGNRTKTARDLGVDPRTIFRHLEKLEAEQFGAAAGSEEDFEVDS